MTKIARSEIRGVIIKSLKSTTHYAGSVGLHLILEDLGIHEEARKDSFKTILIDGTIRLLDENEAVDLEEYELEQVSGELYSKIEVGSHLTLRSFENHFIQLVNAALPGDISIDKDPER